MLLAPIPSASVSDAARNNNTTPYPLTTSHHKPPQTTMSTVNVLQVFVALKPFISIEKQPAALALVVQLLLDSLAVGNSAHEHRVDDSTYGGACVFGVTSSKRCKKAVSTVQSGILLRMQAKSPALFDLLAGRCLCGEHASAVLSKPIKAQEADDNDNEKTMTHLTLFTSSSDFTSSGHPMVRQGGRAVSETVRAFLAERAQLFDQYTKLTNEFAEAAASASAKAAKAENPATKTGTGKATKTGTGRGKGKAGKTEVHIEQGKTTADITITDTALDMQAPEPNDNDNDNDNDNSAEQTARPKEADFNLDDATRDETNRAAAHKTRAQSTIIGTGSTVKVPKDLGKGY